MSYYPYYPYYPYYYTYLYSHSDLQLQLSKLKVLLGGPVSLPKLLLRVLHQKQLLLDPVLKLKLQLKTSLDAPESRLKLPLRVPLGDQE